MFFRIRLFGLASLTFGIFFLFQNCSKPPSEEVPPESLENLPTINTSESFPSAQQQIAVSNLGSSSEASTATNSSLNLQAGNGASQRGNGSAGTTSGSAGSNSGAASSNSGAAPTNPFSVNPINSPIDYPGDLDLIVGDSSVLEYSKAHVPPGVSVVCSTALFNSLNNTPGETLKLWWTDLQAGVCNQTVTFSRYIVINSEVRIHGNMRVTGQLVIDNKGKLIIEGGTLELGSRGYPGVIYVAPHGAIQMTRANSNLGSAISKPWGVILNEGEWLFGEVKANVSASEIIKSTNFHPPKSVEGTYVYVDANMGVASDQLIVGGKMSGNVSAGVNVIGFGSTSFMPVFAECQDETSSCKK